eukprot:3366225-Pyramimonas_sp.AAC.1
MTSDRRLRASAMAMLKREGDPGSAACVQADKVTLWVMAGRVQVPRVFRKNALCATATGAAGEGAL